MRSNNSAVEPLCLTCGLCCSGALFKDVEIQPGDDPARLEALGIPLERLRRKTHFPQPCAALGADCRCRIYTDRPSRCRAFECALLKTVAAGRVELTAAQRTIQQARQRADTVRKLLRALGDRDEDVALSLRFRRTQRRLERCFPDETTAATYAELTLAVHEFQLFLRRHFYPGPAD